MATTNVVSTMGGLFKKVYAPKVKYAYPNGVEFIRAIPFKKEIGASYDQPVTLQFENGFTLAAPGAGAFTIKDPVVGVSVNATVDGYQCVLSSEVDYEAAAKASKAGEKAFVKATRHIVKNMTDSHRKMLEIQCLYGRADIGVVGTVSTNDVVITKASWSPAIWAGATGLNVEAFTSDLATMRTGTGVVSAVNMTTRTISFTSAPAAIAPDDRLFFLDALTAGATPVYAENIGIHTALATSGSVWGINNSTYSLWKAPSVAAGNQPINFDHIQEGAARIAEQGGIGGRIRCYVSAQSFVDLIGDQAALRRFDKGDGNMKWKTGAESLCFYTASGPVEIVPSIFVKRGFAYMLNLDCWLRTGAQDFAFGDPLDKQVFHRLESKAGADLRSYSNVSVFSDALGQNVLITGIVDSAAS